MKNILIVCVNYNSYLHLDRFLESIEDAMQLCTSCNIEVIIADNSSIKNTINSNKYKSFNIAIHQFENLGYLGGAFAVINKNDFEITLFDYLIISNVDIIIEKNFFNDLCKNEFNEDIGWIAPKIYSEKEGRDRNPKITNRLSLAKMNLLRILYKYPSLFRLHKKTFHKRKRKEYPEHTELEIYAGHGSFIILTRNFLKKQNRFNYPVFLFGEEIFFGELMKNADLKVLYLPKLKLYDIDHVSTSQFDDKWYCKENFKAVSFLIEKFYE